MRARSRRPGRRPAPGSCRRPRPRRHRRTRQASGRRATTPAWSPGRRPGGRLSVRPLHPWHRRRPSRLRRSGGRRRRGEDPRRTQPSCHLATRQIFDTPQSPLVTWRGCAPRRTSTTWRCDHRSTKPSSSQRQSIRVMRRAIGASSPTGLAAHEEARRVDVHRDGRTASPFGDQATSPTDRSRGVRIAHGAPAGVPFGDEGQDPRAARPRPRHRTWCLDAAGRARPPESAGTRSPTRPGATRGLVSRTGPRVSWIGLPRPSSGMSHRCERYRSATTNRRTTTANRPSAEMSCSSRTTCARMTDRPGVRGMVESSVRSRLKRLER